MEKCFFFYFRGNFIFAKILACVENILCTHSTDTSRQQSLIFKRYFQGTAMKIPEKKLRGLSPNFRTHLSHLYGVCERFPESVNIFSCSIIGRPFVGIYKLLADTRKWKLGLRPRNSFSGNIGFKFSVLSLCSVANSAVK
jgi:hypothetical protein